MSTIPAMMVAGTHSGVGKTTVTLGLMAALRERGLRVQPFKVGPDFIDPSHHTAICQRASRNLDVIMMDESGVRRSFDNAILGSDVAVVEGVMGLFDGIGSSDTGSSAHVARILKVPVILTVNVHGMSRSAAAIVKGFHDYDPNIVLAGVILNQVGSQRHLKILEESLDVPILGALPRQKDISLPSRHLGLTMGFETSHDIHKLARLLEENADIDRLLNLCTIERKDSPDGDVAAQKTSDGISIGIANDEAFCFYYQDNLDVLARSGANLVMFSPLKDDLPQVDGVYLGGGYPELYADVLESAPASVQLKKAADDGMPIYGECGGLMYLSRSLVTEERTFRMSGILPAETIMTKRLQALGYVEAKVERENAIVSTGCVVKGHEFHYSRMECDRDARMAYRLLRGKGIRDGWDGLMEHNVLGGYLHSHFSSFPVEGFLRSCRSYKRR